MKYCFLFLYLKGYLNKLLKNISTVYAYFIDSSIAKTKLYCSETGKLGYMKRPFDRGVMND